jgi:hypothetical protein
LLPVDAAEVTAAYGATVEEARARVDRAVQQWIDERASGA